MSYHIEFTDQANDDIAFHKKAGDKQVLNKILLLLDELAEHPFTGTGKPEQLKHNLAGRCSRRINHKHRLVYRVENDTVFILSAKDHYD